MLCIFARIKLCILVHKRVYECDEMREKHQLHEIKHVALEAWYPMSREWTFFGVWLLSETNKSLNENWKSVCVVPPRTIEAISSDDIQISSFHRWKRIHSIIPRSNVQHNHNIRATSSHSFFFFFLSHSERIELQLIHLILHDENKNKTSSFISIFQWETFKMCRLTLDYCIRFRVTCLICSTLHIAEYADHDSNSTVHCFTCTNNIGSPREFYSSWFCYEFK